MKYDFTCKECGHEFDYHEGVVSGGYFEEDYINCPFCKGIELIDNKTNDKI